MKQYTVPGVAYKETNQGRMFKPISSRQEVSVLPFKFETRSTNSFTHVQKKVRIQRYQHFHTSTTTVVVLLLWMFVHKAQYQPLLLRARNCHIQLSQVLQLKPN